MTILFCQSKAKSISQANSFNHLKVNSSSLLVLMLLHITVYSNFNTGILLHGPPGCGKTMVGYNSDLKNHLIILLNSLWLCIINFVFLIERWPKLPLKKQECDS
jgi:hypothetical protein